jgi:hypothetical protein
MSRPRQSGSILAALLVAALLVVRAAVPLGWMPAQTQDGIRVLLCTGDGSAARTIELFVPIAGVDGQGSGEHPDDPPRDPCPFGLSFAKAFDLPAPIALPQMPAIAALGKAPEAVTARIVAARGVRPPARGPPVAA